MTPMGRVIIVKTYIISQLTYLFLNLPSPPSEYFLQIDKLIFNFIWNGKVDKIKRGYMRLNKDEGGLNVPHLRTQDKVLKILWLHRILNTPFDDNLFKQINNMFYGGLKYILTCNLSQEEIEHKIVNTDFQHTIEKIVVMKKPNTMLYNKLKISVTEEHIDVLYKWQCDDFEITFDRFYSAFQMIYTSLIFVKLRMFQFKLLHRRLALNPFLHRIGIKDDAFCSSCGKEVETEIHFFWFCTKNTQMFRCFIPHDV